MTSWNKSAALILSLVSLPLAFGSSLGCSGTPAGSTGKLSGIPKAGDQPEAPQIVPVGDVPPEVRALTGKILAVAARIRHLRVKAPVNLSVLSGADLVGIVKKHVKEEIPPEVIRAEGTLFETLGLTPAGYKYEEETYGLLEEELAGLYMPEAKTMYLASTVKGDELGETLAHELVHALQDQYFDIGGKMKYQAGASDALGALQALAEGDATSAMIDELIYAKKGEEGLAQMTAADLPDRGAEEFLEEALKDKKPDAALKRAPRFIAVGLIAPYADGLTFVNAVRRRGGWEAVNAAWGKPPASTEQLLHLDKYDAAEKPVLVPFATGAALGTGWTKAHDDVFGEQEGRIAFAEWMSLPGSHRAATGWGGDHVTMYDSGDQHAVAWRILFDDEADAKDAAQLLSLGWGKAYGTSQVKGDLEIWGAPIKAPPPPLPAGKEKPTGEKKAPPPPPKGKLPQLPDATNQPQPGTPPPVLVPMKGCRGLQTAGKGVTLFAGVPCDKISAWSAEVAK